MYTEKFWNYTDIEATVSSNNIITALSYTQISLTKCLVHAFSSDKTINDIFDPFFQFSLIYKS